MSREELLSPSFWQLLDILVLISVLCTQDVLGIVVAWLTPFLPCKKIIGMRPVKTCPLSPAMCTLHHLVWLTIHTLIFVLQKRLQRKTTLANVLNGLNVKGRSLGELQMALVQKYMTHYLNMWNRIYRYIYTCINLRVVVICMYTGIHVSILQPCIFMKARK